MKQPTILAASLLLFPAITHAQDFQTFLVAFTNFLSGVFIPFLIGMAFLFFIINVIRYFVLGGSNQEDQEKAKSLALYGIMAFVLMITFWGIVNMLVNSIGGGGQSAPTSDYIQMQGFPGGPTTDDPCDIDPTAPFCTGTGNTG
ncbi:hypothetical protein H6778_02825 [Candidatus Nomurabacteria bacterium]|nr:hypothetical protein [Candidatus Nomurabacteria bacterium]